MNIIFCGLQKQFTTKETKAKFLSYKNFCATFVPFVVFSFD
jgi:hypothetical protein